jgi:hypothetical protein
LASNSECHVTCAQSLSKASFIFRFIFRDFYNEYPVTLASLVPQFLAQVPRDLIGGQPLHYRRSDDGKFLLYSVGWNEKDDGGKAGSEDDWVWDDHAR